MLDKKQIKFIKGFMLEYGMTRKELAYEAGISVRTLYTAISTGKVSDETYDKIINAMMSETIQRGIIVQMPRRREFTGLKLSLIVSAIIAAAIAASIF